ncbi:MAG: hypothetical protein AB1578_20655 [Thermodesulfobacteriota bacterium]
MDRMLDADRPFLEQFEEEALEDDEAFDWLLEEVYAHPERLAVLTGTRLEE